MVDNMRERIIGRLEVLGFIYGLVKDDKLSKLLEELIILNVSQLGVEFHNKELADHIKIDTIIRREEQKEG